MNRRRFLELLGLGTAGAIVASATGNDIERRYWATDTNDYAVLHTKGYVLNDWEEQISLQLKAQVRHKMNVLTKEMYLKS